MEMQFKGIKIGRLIITTESKLRKSEFYLDKDQVKDLLQRAKDEGII